MRRDGATRTKHGVRTPPDPVAAHLSKLLARCAPSAQSLLVTLFGDCVAVHGGRVWLGSLIDALAPFGIGDRLTRTSVFRLVQDDWLAVERSGRRAYYAFTEHGRREYERTARRVYATERAPWDGAWTLAIPHAVSGPARERLRASLGWIGFGQLSPGVFAHPSADRVALADLIDEQKLGDRVLIVDARIGDVASLGAIAQARWNVTQLATRYRRFVADFEPLTAQPLQRTDGRIGFVARTLLIHEYRRILLTDPDLPDALLPTDWPGRDAAQLTRTLYRKLARATNEFVMARFVNADGPVPPADRTFARRFAEIEP
jgi:phenylacetic acid degradation operon negative regulatory protein